MFSLHCIHSYSLFFYLSGQHTTILPRTYMQPGSATTSGPSPQDLSMAGLLMTTLQSTSSRTLSHPVHHPQCKQREEDYPSPDLAGVVKHTSQDMEVENSMSINLLIRDTRDPIMRARALFPESLNWEALGPDLDRGLVPPLLGAEAPRCHPRITYSAS